MRTFIKKIAACGCRAATEFQNIRRYINTNHLILGEEISFLLVWVCVLKVLS